MEKTEEGMPRAARLALGFLGEAPIVPPRSDSLRMPWAIRLALGFFAEAGPFLLFSLSWVSEGNEDV